MIERAHKVLTVALYFLAYGPLYDASIARHGDHGLLVVVRVGVCRLSVDPLQLPDRTHVTAIHTAVLTHSWGGSVAEWLARWTRAQKGLGSNRSSIAVG